MFDENQFKVTVKTRDLLKTLKSNREAHESDYETAKTGFRILLIKELEKKLQAAKSGQKVELSFKNQKPDNHLNDYDDVIGMLEMSQDMSITISHSQYKQYVKDDWTWKRSWSTSNVAYLSAAVNGA